MSLSVHGCSRLSEKHRPRRVSNPVAGVGRVDDQVSRVRLPKCAVGPESRKKNRVVKVEYLARHLDESEITGHEPPEPGADQLAIDQRGRARRLTRSICWFYLNASLSSRLQRSCHCAKACIRRFKEELHPIFNHARTARRRSKGW